MKAVKDDSASDQEMQKVLERYFAYQTRIHELQRPPTRDEAAEVYSEDCQMIFSGKNPIIGKTFNGIDDWLTVYDASFGIVDYVNIENEYTEAVGANFAFNHDSHMMTVGGDDFHFERVTMLKRSENRISVLRILEYDQFSFDDFLRKHHPDAPSLKRQWRSHTSYFPIDSQNSFDPDHVRLKAAIEKYLLNATRREFGERMNGLASVLTDDAELIVQCRNPFGYGVYQGVQEWRNYFSLANRLSKTETVSRIVIEAVGEERGFGTDIHTIGFSGIEKQFQRLLVFRQRDGKICQLRILYFDPYAFDEFVCDGLLEVSI